MHKFEVSETLACWVTFTKVIEAIDEETAEQFFNEGCVGDYAKQDGEVRQEIGDNIDGYDNMIVVTKVE